MGGKVLPIYLLIDLGEPGAGPVTTSANAFYRQFVDALRSGPGLAERVRLTVGVFGEKATRLLTAAPVRAVTASELPPGGPRSYATALHTLAHWIREDLAHLRTQSPSPAQPLVLVLTPGPPAAGDEWRGEMERLTAEHPGVVIEPIGHFEGHRWSAALRHPAGDRHPAGPRDPLIAARAIVWEHAGAVAPSPRPAVQEAPARPAVQEAPARPAATAAPAWQGAFTRYQVGDPGAAATQVRPRPDPAEWDRRDTVLDGVYIRDDLGDDRLQLRAASVRGLAHRYNGTVRQDDYAFRCTEDGRHLVLVVADGVSSGRLSHRAASLVCRLGAELVAAGLAVKPPGELDWPEVMAQLSHEILRLARQRPGAAEPTHREVVAEMATTALFGVVELRPESGDPDLVAHVASIGDSSAWVLRDGGGWAPLQKVKNSDAAVASSATRALPLRSVPAEVEVRTAMVRRGEALVLMSDGVGDPLLDGDGPVGRFLAGAWRRPPAPIEFAAQVDFARRSHDDDRTVVAVWVE